MAFRLYFGIFAVSVVGVLLSAGCGVEKNFDKPTQALIDMDGQSFNIESSGNKNCKDGVSYLRTEQWDLAVKSLESSVGENPDDKLALKALGVAYDKKGDAKKAYEAYSKANLLFKKDGDPLVTARLLALKDKAK